MARERISAHPDSLPTYLGKLWKYRQLIWVFAIRDLKVKYSQTIIGLAWSVIQPLTALVIFTFFFGYVLDWKADSLPYSVYILSGLLGWNFFSYIVSSGSASIQESSHLIKKVYFPKSVLPLSKVLVAFVELMLSLVLLIPLLLYYKISVSVNVVFIPLVLTYNAICGLAVVFWVAAFAYQKRDLFHLLPFVLYFGIWLTPVFFTADFLPESVCWMLDLNPMAQVIDLWRWSVFSYQDIGLTHLTGFLSMALKTKIMCSKFSNY